MGFYKRHRNNGLHCNDAVCGEEHQFTPASPQDLRDVQAAGQEALLAELRRIARLLETIAQQDRGPRVADGWTPPPTGHPGTDVPPPPGLGARIMGLFRRDA